MRAFSGCKNIKSFKLNNYALSIVHSELHGEREIKLGNLVLGVEKSTEGIVKPVKLLEDCDNVIVYCPYYITDEQLGSISDKAKIVKANPSDSLDDDNKKIRKAKSIGVAVVEGRRSKTKEEIIMALKTMYPEYIRRRMSELLKHSIEQGCKFIDSTEYIMEDIGLHFKCEIYRSMVSDNLEDIGSVITGKEGKNYNVYITSKCLIAMPNSVEVILDKIERREYKIEDNVLKLRVDIVDVKKSDIHSIEESGTRLLIKKTNGQTIRL